MSRLVGVVMETILFIIAVGFFIQLIYSSHQTKNLESLILYTTGFILFIVLVCTKEILAELRRKP